MSTPDKTVLILGGTSDIGRAVAKAYAATGWSVMFAARNQLECERNARDLALRYGVPVLAVKFDVSATERFVTFVSSLPVLPDTVVSVVGLYGKQEQAQDNLDHATEILRTNFEGPALLLGVFAGRMAERGSGTIVGVSSVAGDRGRASNYVYGSAKAGFTAFLSGLRGRLAKQHIHVLTVKPGYVRTRMTEGMILPRLITCEPDAIGLAVYRAAEETKRDVLYFLSVWRCVMVILRLIPERIFKRMKI